MTSASGNFIDNNNEKEYVNIYFALTTEKINKLNHAQKIIIK